MGNNLPSNSKFKITQVSNCGFYESVDLKNLNEVNKSTQNSIAKEKIKEKLDQNTLRVVCISDTHEQESKLEMPEGDILIHTGDIT